MGGEHEGWPSLKQGLHLAGQRPSLKEGGGVKLTWWTLCHPLLSPGPFAPPGHQISPFKIYLTLNVTLDGQGNARCLFFEMDDIVNITRGTTDPEY